MDSSQQRMLIYQLVQMRLLKTVYGRFPTTDAALLLIQLQLLKTVYRFSKHGCQSIACSDPQFRDVPKHGYLSDTRPLTNDIQFNKHFQMASLSPSSYQQLPDGISKPILRQDSVTSLDGISKPITKWHLKAHSLYHHITECKFFGHSSV